MLEATLSTLSKLVINQKVVRLVSLYIQCGTCFKGLFQ